MRRLWQHGTSRMTVPFELRQIQEAAAVPRYREREAADGENGLQTTIIISISRR